MRLFDRRVAGQDKEAVKRFLLRRYNALMDPSYGIVKPCDLPRSEWYKPFDTMDERTWKTIRESLPGTKLNPNPFAPSVFREDGMALWDNVCGLPACSLRRDTVFSKDILPRRNINEHWEVVQNSMRRVGNLGNTRIKRPSGPYIYDLHAIPVDMALMVTDIANVLVGMYREKMECGHTNDGTYGSMYQLYSRTLAYVVHAIVYDVPIRVDFRAPGGPEGYAGNGVRISSDCINPVLLVPRIGVDAPAFEKSVTETLVACQLQAHPSGYEQQMETWEYDFLGCQTSCLTIAGWEAEDWVTHQTLACPYNNAPTHYAASAADLLDPDSYWTLMALGLHTVKAGEPALKHPEILENATRKAIEKAAERVEQAKHGLYGDEAFDAEDAVWLHAEGIKWMRPLEWVKTEHFKWMQSRTECLPKKEYLRVNRNTEDAPKKPYGRTPDTPIKKMKPEWRDWFKSMDNIFQVVKNSRKKQEGLVNGERLAKSSRSTRRKHAVRRRKHIYKRCQYEDIMLGIKVGRQPSEKKRLYAMGLQRIPKETRPFFLED